LPLPDTLAPVEIRGFRRLDTVAEIRDLAKTWQNCLADYVFNVNDGTSAIYLADQFEAVCFLARHGRMGWFLVQAKGPKNATIELDQLAQIYDAFAAVGHNLLLVLAWLRILLCLFLAALRCALITDPKIKLAS
jgi:hypothetical protein